LARLVPPPIPCVTARFNALEVNPMFASRLLFCVAALALAAPSFATTTRQVMTPKEMREHRAVSNFLNAVDHYVVVDHRVTKAIEPGVMCLPDHTLAEINELADIPFDARPMPQEGDIFAPDVAEIFRDRIGAALRHQGINVWDLVAEMNEDELMASPVIVATPLPWGVGDRTIGYLTAGLPSLPEELEYRLVARDLVLFDLRANMVVDVLRAALPVY